MEGVSIKTRHTTPHVLICAPVCHVHPCASHLHFIWLVFRPVDLWRLCARPQPSARDSFPLVTCGFLQKRGQRGALAAVCTPTLKSAGKKHQNCAPPCLSTAYGTLKVVKRTVYCVYILALANNLFSSPLCVASRLRASNRSVFWENLPKLSNPVPNILSAI